MKYIELERIISQPRLDRYLVACGNSKIRTKKLYNINLRLSQSFYPVLNLFEIILRNEIHYNLSNHFSNPNWVITEKNGFMNDSSLTSSSYFLKKQVEKAERKIRRRNSRITAGKIIAEPSLGFWTSLFEVHHYRLIGGSVIGCFPNKSRRINRRALEIRLSKIRDFRNRVYHNEPICFRGNSIDFQQAEKVKEDIFDILSWMNINTKQYVEMYNTIDSKISIGKRI